MLQRMIAELRDQDAYKQLFIRYYSRLFSFARTLLGRDEFSEEVVSDVMMELWLMGERLGRIENLEAYLFMSVRNRALSCLRGLGRQGNLDTETVAAGLNLKNDTPEEGYLRDEFQRIFVQAVESLPPQCRQAYKLVREEGFSYKDAARIMGISSKTVDRHIVQAVKKLVEKLQPYFGVHRR